ncbi:DUF1320 domain-containing protein [uncultured Lamprocystis sp.]|jgi:phage gp36-like protein|uniref:gp436 family protein n=1 Tax=uncultured Lamprocystis sp. TaxID=543132 RepID=UPI0025D83F98|nr:DUF1320 domain-containing protein [uncultured Lamprocystis sp.]
MSHPYCTQADLLRLRLTTEAELLQLTDPSGLGVIDTAAVSAAAVSASIEIDPYLAPRLSVPLTTVPAPVCRLAGILTVYALYGLAPTEHRQRQYEAAIKTLTGIAAGTLSIGAGDTAAPPPADPAVQWGSEPAAWGRGAEGGL